MVAQAQIAADPIADHFQGGASCGDGFDAETHNG
jgi:hypothetical protein